jgi:hypothetical protein
MLLPEHIRYGKYLKEVRNTLLNMSCDIANSYAQTRKGYKAAKKLISAYRKIDEARSLLEDELFNEHRENATTHIYY